MTSELSNDWRHVDPAYKTQLRTHATIKLLVVLVLVLAGNYVADLAPFVYSALLAGLAAFLWLFWILFWIPRRYKLTKYYLAEDCIHFRTGALWRMETSVTHNRLQHLELEHGPLERVLSICRIVLYTAGGQGADLTLPGMNQETAQGIKAQLLDQIEQEVLLDEAITQAPSAQPATEANETLSEDSRE